MARKTVAVLDVIEMANHHLRTTEDTDEAQQRRYAVASFLEAILHKADAYAGFGYLPSAGVNYDAIHRGEPFHAEDESRRQYHVHSKLR